MRASVPTLDGLRIAQPHLITLLFGVLAALTLGTIAINLQLTETYRGNYEATIKEANEWKEYDAAVAELGNLLTKLHSADTGGPIGTGAGFDGSHRDFVAETNALKRALRGEIAWGHANVPQLITALAEAARAESLWYGDARQLLGSVAERTPLASVKSLTGSYRLAMLKLSKAREMIRDTQEAWWTRRFQALERLRAFQVNSAIAMAAIVFLVLGFAHLVQRNLARLGQKLNQAEATRLREAARFKQFAEVASDWMWDSDTNLRLTWISDGINAGGAPRKDMIGRHLFDGVLADLDAEGHLKAFPSRFAGRKPFANMLLPFGDPNSPQWISSSAAPYFNTDGSFAGYRGVSRDVTGLMHTQAALAKARDAAETASRVKSEFLAMMSHEIRTPMNGVLGMTGVLLDTPLSDEQRRSARTIRECAENLLGIINDVLDFSKLDAQAMEFERVAFDLHALLAYAAEIVEPRAKTKAIRLNLAIDAGVPQFVHGDPGRLRQILLNFLSNAIKFTEEGSVTLKATPATAAGGSISLRFEVVDTGVGIPADRIGRLFQSFSQADASISRQYGGTGLGLAICKRLIEQMGGSVGVKSLVGVGSTFWFELPATIADGAEVRASTHAIHEERFNAAVQALHDLGRPVRLLVVEDNATNQLVARSVLGKYSIVPDVAGNGLEAVEALRRQAYDVVLMDIHMPEMDGLEATKVIRGLPGQASNVPIVALTANAFSQDVEECRSAGMNAHIGKPFRREDLIVAIADAVKGTLRFDLSAKEDGAADEAVDWGTLDRFKADSGEEMFRLLIDTFVADAQDKLAKLSAIARNGGSHADAVRHAHSLKSAGAMAGAGALSRFAAALEKQLRENSKLRDDDAATLSRMFAAYHDELKGRGLIAA